MPLLEKEVEDMIFNASREFIKERGLTCFDHDVCLRQVNLGPYGIADLITIKFHRSFHSSRLAHVTIYELKKDQIGVSTLLQVSGYYRAVKSFVSELGVIDFKIKVCLIGSEVDLKSNFIYLASLSDISCYTYSYDQNGIHFEEVVADDYVANKIEEYDLFPVRPLKRWYQDFYRKYLLSNPFDQIFS